ncbi:hypothetical protein ASD14_13740 [Lysobacter sp. Root494]|nr:hypothetical protein ASD14_13740 [Lysobacter sp. Root494]
MPNAVVVNGQPSQPNQNQGGLFQWSFVGAPVGTLANANSPQVQLTPFDVAASTQGILRLTVTVSGCPGISTKDVPVTVTNAHDVVINLPPHAVPVASPSTASEGMVVTLDGSGSWDVDNPSLTYAWLQTVGPAVTLANTGNPAIKTFVAPNFADDTQLTFRLTVSDGTLSNSDTTFVNVSWTNDSPVAGLVCPDGMFEVNEGQSVTFDASGSTDSDDGIATYEWAQLVGLPEVTGVADWNTAVVTFNAPQLGFGETGLVPFKLTVTDHHGAKSTANCAIFVHDITKPLLSVPQSPLVAEATSADGANVAYEVSAFDAVDGDLPFPSPYLLCEPPPGSLFALDSLSPVLCSAEDSAGNGNTATFSVSVVDSTAPAISVPLSFAVEATGPDGAPADYVAKSNDAVDGERDAVCMPASGSTFPLNTPGPTTTVHCDATDAHGNEATTRTFTVAVHDTTPPDIDAATVSADLVAEATSPSGASVSFGLPSAHDLVDLDAVLVTCAPGSPHVFPLGETVVQCDAVDSRGNSTADATPGTSATFKVTVRDTTAPVFGPVSNHTVEAQSGAGASFAYALPTATDVVDGDRTVTCTEAPALALPGVFPLGSTTVTCSASDTRGNGGSTSFQVTVVDTTAPSLDLPANITAEATGSTGAVVNFAVAASDAVDADVQLVCSSNSGDTFALGTTTVQCIGTDDAGNSAGGNFTITVQDTTGPAISAHETVTAYATGNSAATVTYTVPTAVDLVDGPVVVTCTPASGSSFNVGTTTVTCSAKDSRNNPSNSTFAVTVTYNFTGFFQPIDNGTMNSVKAGSAIPVKFSLGGNQGLNIFDPGPASGVIACSATDGDAIEETVTAGNSSLQFDPGSNQYIYVWKTEKSWAGQCRVLQVKLKGGTQRSALFKFK